MHDPVQFNYFKLVAGYSIDDWLEDDTSASASTHVYLFPRHGQRTSVHHHLLQTNNNTGPVPGEKNRTCYCLFKAPPSFSHHHVHAFEEQETGDIVIDRIAYATRPPLLMESVAPTTSSLANGAGPGQIQRMRLAAPTVWGTQRSECGECVAVEILTCSPVCCEMPVVNVAKHGGIGLPLNCIYSVDTCAVLGPWTGINKSNIAHGTNVTWRPKEDRTFVGEPVFVPFPREENVVEGEEEEDAGWLLFLGFHAAEKRSSMYVLDATTMEQVCRVGLKGFIPWSHHCTWNSGVYHDVGVGGSSKL